MANDFYKDLEELEDLIEDAFHIPLFKGKVILDESRFFDIMDNIRQNLPIELKKSKELLENKETMMNRVKEDSDIMKEKARKAAEQMLVKAKKNSDAMIVPTLRTFRKRLISLYSFLSAALRAAFFTVFSLRTPLKKTIYRRRFACLQHNAEYVTFGEEIKNEHFFKYGC